MNVGGLRVAVPMAVALVTVTFAMWVGVRPHLALYLASRRRGDAVRPPLFAVLIPVACAWLVCAGVCLLVIGSALFG